ncbi:hypothetical protein ACFQX8_11055 [Klenkia terrae]|uniref:hypothetical protein n=1 Tax=Klenkia terrae TaxID=1052259 RepID=UPI0036076FDD
MHLAGALVVGPLPGVLAAVAAASARATPLVRRRVRVVLGVGLTMLVLYGGTGGDVHRLAGWGVGLLAGQLLLRRRGARVERGPVSRRESRALVALVVAASAVGPLVAALARSSNGPWSVVSHLFVSGAPDAGTLRQVCGTARELADCRVLTGRSHLAGLGPALLSALPALVQLVLAEGLRRGRRAAWVGAVVFSAVLAAVGGEVVTAVLRDPDAALTALGTPRGGLPVAAVWAPLAAPAAVLVLLLLTRSRFPVPAAPGTARRWAALAGGGLGVVVLAYLGAGVLLRGEWATPPTVGRLLLDLPARMLPPGWLGEVLPSLAPSAVRPGCWRTGPGWPAGRSWWGRRGSSSGRPCPAGTPPGPVPWSTGTATARCRS